MKPKVALIAILFMKQGCSDDSGSSNERKRIKKPTSETTDGDQTSSDSADGSVVAPNSQVNIGGKSFTALAASSLKQVGSGVSGVGSLLAASTSSTRLTENNFSFSAKISEGGFIKITTFASQALASGVELAFKVSSGKLKLQVGGKDFSSKLGTISTNGVLNIAVDVHNSEANPHVLVWVNASSKTPQNAVMNSEGSGLNVARGVGKNWGFEISGASLNAASIGAPVFQE